jgi:hypothetical protein
VGKEVKKKFNGWMSRWVNGGITGWEIKKIRTVVVHCIRQEVKMKSSTFGVV